MFQTGIAEFVPVYRIMPTNGALEYSVSIATPVGWAGQLGLPATGRSALRM